MKKILAFFTAVLIMLTTAFSCFAVLGSADPDNPDAGITYADIQNEGATAITEPEREILYERGISEDTANRINKLIMFWNNYGLLTILIVLAVIVAIATAVSFHEKKKLRQVIKDIDTDQQPD